MSSRTPTVRVGMDDAAVRAKMDELIGSFRDLKKAAGEALDADQTAG